MTKIQMAKTKTAASGVNFFVLNFEFLNFGFVSDFGFRISDLLYSGLGASSLGGKVFMVSGRRRAVMTNCQFLHIKWEIFITFPKSGVGVMVHSSVHCPSANP